LHTKRATSVSSWFSATWEKNTTGELSVVKKALMLSTYGLPNTVKMQVLKSLFAYVSDSRQQPKAIKTLEKYFVNSG